MTVEAREVVAEVDQTLIFDVFRITEWCSDRTLLHAWTPILEKICSVIQPHETTQSSSYVRATTLGCFYLLNVTTTLEIWDNWVPLLNSTPLDYVTRESDYNNITI